jgi:hypothetical protein
VDDDYRTSYYVVLKLSNLEEQDYSYYLSDGNASQRLRNIVDAFEYQDKVEPHDDDVVQIHHQRNGALLEDLSDIQEWEFQYRDSFP